MHKPKRIRKRPFSSHFQIAERKHAHTHLCRLLLIFPLLNGERRQTESFEKQNELLLENSFAKSNLTPSGNCGRRAAPDSTALVFGAH